MMVEEWFKYWVEFVDWRWYKNPPTRCVFEHLLTMTRINHGRPVLTTYRQLALANGLTYEQVRRAIRNLTTPPAEIRATRRGKSLRFEVVNWGRYQAAKSTQATHGGRPDGAQGAHSTPRPPMPSRPTACDGERKRAHSERTGGAQQPHGGRSSLSLLQEEEREEEKKTTTTSTTRQSDYLARARGMAAARGQAAGGAEGVVGVVANVWVLDFKKGLRED